jgi:hypothetical protein
LKFSRSLYTSKLVATDFELSKNSASSTLQNKWTWNTGKKDILKGLFLEKNMGEKCAGAAYEG